MFLVHGYATPEFALLPESYELFKAGLLHILKEFFFKVVSTKNNPLHIQYIYHLCLSHYIGADLFICFPYLYSTDIFHNSIQNTYTVCLWAVYNICRLNSYIHPNLINAEVYINRNIKLFLAVQIFLVC